MTDNRMLPTGRVDSDVEVHIDCHWWPGILEHRRRVDDRWEGFVRWSTGTGENRIGWCDYDQLRQSTVGNDRLGQRSTAQIDHLGKYIIESLP